MVAYIQKRLHIYLCIPSGAGTEGEEWGVWWSGNRLWHAAPGPPPTCNFWLRPCSIHVDPTTSWITVSQSFFSETMDGRQPSRGLTHSSVAVRNDNKASRWDPVSLHSVSNISYIT